MKSNMKMLSVFLSIVLVLVSACSTTAPQSDSSADERYVPVSDPKSRLPSPPPVPGMDSTQNLPVTNDLVGQATQDWCDVYAFTDDECAGESHVVDLALQNPSDILWGDDNQGDLTDGLDDGGSSVNVVARPYVVVFSKECSDATLGATERCHVVAPATCPSAVASRCTVYSQNEVDANILKPVVNVPSDASTTTEYFLWKKGYKFNSFTNQWQEFDWAWTFGPARNKLGGPLFGTNTFLNENWLQLRLAGANTEVLPETVGAPLQVTPASVPFTFPANDPDLEFISGGLTNLAAYGPASGRGASIEDHAVLVAYACKCTATDCRNQQNWLCNGLQGIQNGQYEAVLYAESEEIPGQGAPDIS